MGATILHDIHVTRPGASLRLQENPLLINPSGKIKRLCNGVAATEPAIAIATKKKENMFPLFFR